MIILLSKGMLHSFVSFVCLFVFFCRCTVTHISSWMSGCQREIPISLVSGRRVSGSSRLVKMFNYQILLEKLLTYKSMLFKCLTFHRIIFIFIYLSLYLFIYLFTYLFTYFHSDISRDPHFPIFFLIFLQCIFLTFLRVVRVAFLKSVNWLGSRGFYGQLGQVRLGQVRLGQVRIGQLKPFIYSSLGVIWVWETR